MDADDRFELRESSGRSARIVVRPDCSVMVYSPKGFDAESFVRDHRDWIREKQYEFRRIASSCSEYDGRLMLWGRHYHLVHGKRCRIDHDMNEVLYSSPAALKRHLKGVLKEEVTGIADHYCGLLGVSYGGISIRNQRTRWGSCSARGNLNFNLRILSLPPPLIRYVVAHEVCHLKVPNHSADFWTLAGTLYPENRAARRELKKYWVILENNSAWKSLEGA